MQQRSKHHEWTPLSLSWDGVGKAEAEQSYLTQVRKLVRLSKIADPSARANAVRDYRRSLTLTSEDWPRKQKQKLLAGLLVISDLVAQGWPLRVRAGTAEVHPPTRQDETREDEKKRIREQELLKRDAQLDESSVREFIRYMEKPRLYNEKFVSVFSLMRDGRELAAALSEAREHDANGWADALRGVIDPYLDFVSEGAQCRTTGLRLMDVWRYFRHTWSNHYASVPGRSMMFLVRDRAAPFHPVIGIGALSSPVVQLRERDMWVGWHPDAFLADLQRAPSDEVARWLQSVADTAIAQVYVEDFMEDGLLSVAELKNPKVATIETMLAWSNRWRTQHHGLLEHKDHKKAAPAGRESAKHWSARARTDLFKSKRALALAQLLRVRLCLRSSFGISPSAEKLQRLLGTAEGRSAVTTLLKKAKADKIGISVAEITVCGAVQPYNAVLGGKLVAMLSASPELIAEYGRRYARAESEIASAMAGRAVIRPPRLVLLGTSALYRASSQYNRIKVPAERIGGIRGDVLEYYELGYSETFGTSHYSDETAEALDTWLHQSGNKPRANGIFGEGTSPKLRRVRQGLDGLGLPSAALLRHHRARVLYAVSLVRNLRDYLLGLASEPDYLVSPERGSAATDDIAAWWRERWLRNRIKSSDVLQQVAAHTLVRPVRHGARVVLPVEHREQTVLFGDLL